jgi:hypothetical protein
MLGGWRREPEDIVGGLDACDEVAGRGMVYEVECREGRRLRRLGISARKATRLRGFVEGGRDLT